MTEEQKTLTEYALKRVNRNRKGTQVINIINMENTKNNVISTGLPGLDAALGVGGLRRGSMIEIFGDESSGKTALALYLAKQYLQNGESVLYIDTERAMTKETLKAAGIENDNFYILRENILEDALNACVEASIGFGAVVIDSLAGLTTKQQLYDDIDDGSHSYYITRAISSALPILSACLADHNCTLIIINQLREKVGVIFGKPTYSTGGKALKYFFTASLDIRKVDYLKKKGDIIGLRSSAKVVKNKIAKPYGKTEFNIIFGQGVTAS